MINDSPPDKPTDSFSPTHASPFKCRSKIDILYRWGVKNQCFSERVLVDQAIHMFNCSRKSAVFYARSVHDRLTLVEEQQ